MSKYLFQLRKYTLVSLLFTLCVLLSAIGKAQQFPEIETYDLDRHQVIIPHALNEKPSILFLAFSQKAEMELSKWYNPVYTMFLDESGFNAMAYDCEVKMVMMFTGGTAAVADKIVSTVKKEVDPSFAEHLLFYEGSFSKQLSQLGIKKKDDAYVFVIDKNGNILLQESGKYAESKLERIAELVEY